MTGRIDVHAHLLPGIDDGCATLEESIACCRMLASAGYAHAFCTPHIWPNYPENDIAGIARRTAELQTHLTQAGVKLQLHPGGELNLRPESFNTPDEEIVTYALNGKFVLADFWAETLPDFFEPLVRRYQSLGLKVVLAHPERVRAVQLDPPIIEKFLEMDLLLQGNLQCFSDPINSLNRRTVERFLLEERYFLLGSDTHNPQTLPMRLGGLSRAIEMVGLEAVGQLTITNPRHLLPKSAFD